MIFSDKYCEFPTVGPPHIDWNRWYKRAIQRSAKQAHGAERWLRSHPDRVFLDAACTKPFPYEIPSNSDAKYHVVVVAHGCAERCVNEVGGSGSLGIDSHIRGDDHLAREGTPLDFCIGDVAPGRTFVHVLTEISMAIVLKTLDTITDFISYLEKKEALLRSGYRVISAGEEDLMAFYLKDVNEDGEQDFVFPPESDGIFLEDGHWENFCGRPERVRQVEADHLSYACDTLIEKFAFHAKEGSQYHTNEPGIENTERILRMMAREPRTARRSLCKALMGIVSRGEVHDRATRYVMTSSPTRPFYVLMALRKPDHVTYERYREVRLTFLQLCCMALKVRKPEAQHVVGIATEPGLDILDRSEDAIYFDAREWTAEDDRSAREDAERWGILEEYEEFQVHESAYPEA